MQPFASLVSSRWHERVDVAVVGVRVERHVLVHRERVARAGRLHVQRRVVELDVRPEQVLERVAEPLECIARAHACE